MSWAPRSRRPWSVRASPPPRPSPHGPRYGDLEVDSNLPDIRIAVGGPERNSLVAEALAMDPAADRELRRQVAEQGVAAVWVAPRASLREEWVPGADLRDLERLPLLVVAGSDPSGDAKAVDTLIADLDDFTITATAAGGGEALPPGDAWDGRGFAVLNRGTPGCVITSSGDLYMSLMRSCTGWPSGIWVDPPRRTTPDGSGFQLQRWSHTFEYAVVAGEGDWRDLELPRAATSSTTRSRPGCATRGRTRCCPARPPCWRWNRPARCSWTPSSRWAHRWPGGAPSRRTPAAGSWSGCTR